MISFVDLQKKITKLYPKVLQAHVEQKSIFPLIVPFDKTFPKELSQWHDLIEPIIAHSREHHQFGYSIAYTQLHMRKHGVQTVIKEISFDNEAQLIGYLNKQEEYASFTSNVAKILQHYPVLKTWMSNNTSSILEYELDWDSLLAVVSYFVSNASPGIFIREIPVPVHTKFIEQHKAVLYELLNEVLPPAAIQQQYSGVSQFELRFGLKIIPARIRIRLLDATFARYYNNGMTDIEAPVDELANLEWPLQKVIVLENKKNFENAEVFLTLPNMESTAVIFGSGKAVSLLSKLKWLAPIPILYWGDIDAEGFEMLHQLRLLFSQTISFCMNEETYQAFKEFEVKGSGAKERTLDLLTATEKKLYQQCCTKNMRLEQERIAHPFMLELLRKHINHFNA
ncbi:MAG: DUF2220 family protein [Bacteroidetes bacterium]|jgi:hypothetical protein|uniref:Wadjet anti-phage system protein JetD domain-containing protein n=1 Tax=Phnomibacter sp. TaxID=2836217 RepID=UPI002FDED920|nr:DUF2220 family protein [Bacteroidota bacterium]